VPTALYQFQLLIGMVVVGWLALTTLKANIIFRLLISYSYPTKVRKMTDPAAWNKKEHNIGFNLWD
jgi:hypothetical protein